MIFGFFSLVYSYFTYFLSPPFCLFCHHSLHERIALCVTCSLQILPVAPIDLYFSKHKRIKVFALSAYKDPLRSLILAKHSRNETYIRLLAEFVVEQQIIDRLDFDIITFIPLHWTRYASRGFNQAEIIAQAIGHKTGKTVMSLLMRSKKTQLQARLSIEEREYNVKDAFIVNKKFAHAIAGKKILVVDDLFTTGSTVKAVASILWEYQPAQVDVFVVCRVS